jgi:hypothetical protein
LAFILKWMNGALYDYSPGTLHFLRKEGDAYDYVKRNNRSL